MNPDIKSHFSYWGFRGDGRRNSITNSFRVTRSLLLYPGFRHLARQLDCVLTSCTWIHVFPNGRWWRPKNTDISAFQFIHQPINYPHNKPIDQSVLWQRVHWPTDYSDCINTHTHAYKRAHTPTGVYIQNSPSNTFERTFTGEDRSVVDFIHPPTYPCGKTVLFTY